MKKKYLSVLLTILFSVILFFPATGLALNIPNPLAVNSISELIEKITDLIFVIGIALVPIMVIWAAYNFITAGGDPRKVTTARNMLLYIFVGIIIMLTAKGIIAIVKSVLGG